MEEIVAKDEQFIRRGAVALTGASRGRAAGGIVRGIGTVDVRLVAA